VVRPGITGWAQVRYRYGNTVEDAKEKLQYDLFYIKNVSLGLDFLGMFQTIKTVLFWTGRAMKWVFWCSAVLVLYAYLGYPVWLWLRSRWKARQVERSALTPSVSIVMVVRDEETALPGKLRNLTALDYPPTGWRFSWSAMDPRTEQMQFCRSGARAARFTQSFCRNTTEKPAD